MRTTKTTALFAALAATAAKVARAEDLLFADSLKFVEYQEATTKLGHTAKVVSEAEWRAMTTADFAKFKAIVLSDPDCVMDPSPIGFVADTKAVWSPAVSGNVILIGTDPTLHSGGQPGAVTLIDNSIRFAASGSGGTGLYFSLSCYYTDDASATVDALSEFGTFAVRGALGCYNDAHIVASSEAMTSLTDAALSDWSCSVHEAFAEYPTAGVGGFQALAIAKDIMGVGSQSFGDGSSGLPYIISRGAVPAGCGNAKYEPRFGEECDHGADRNGSPGDLCDKSCKCLYGVLDAAAGTCKPAPPSSVGTGLPPAASGGGGSGPYHNATTPVPYPAATAPYPTTAKPTYTPCGAAIVGIEIIKVVDITETCPDGSTETTTVTSCLSTLQRPIYATTTEGYPCYGCVVGMPDPTDFLTVETEYCPATPDPTPTVTYRMCSTCGYTTLTTDTIPGCTVPTAADPATVTCDGCVPYVVETPHAHAQAPPSSYYPADGTVLYTAPATTLAPSYTGGGKAPAMPSKSATYVTAGAPPRNFVAGGLAAAVAAVAAVATLL